MVDAFVTNVPGPVTVILAQEGSHSFKVRPEVRVVVLPHLLSPYPQRRTAAMREFAELLREHESLSVIGADIMDGAYRPSEALGRYAMLEVANAAGLETRILGFSWSSAAPQQVLRAVQRTQPGTRLILRDPQSMRRLRAQIPMISPQLGADSAFLLWAHEDYPPVLEWLEERRLSGSPVVLFNVSGLIHQQQDLMAEYVQIVRGLREAGASVMILPHVIREGDNDLEVCAELNDMVGSDEEVVFVDELLSPGQVGWLVRYSVAVFTGRMHLSVLALREGKPAVVLSTQGKVEGMLSYFGCERMSVTPRPGMASECLDLLGEALGTPSDQLIPASKLADVLDLASTNFEGLS